MKKKSALGRPAGAGFHVKSRPPLWRAALGWAVASRGPPTNQGGNVCHPIQRWRTERGSMAPVPPVSLSARPGRRLVLAGDCPWPASASSESLSLPPSLHVASFSQIASLFFCTVIRSRSMHTFRGENGKKKQENRIFEFVSIGI